MPRADAGVGAYRGGLVVVSHDDAFLARLHIDSWITLDEDGLSHGLPVTKSENPQ